ncbi:hypothetical protein E2C01_000242 [Portunus trituberculatus]|uniref:Uncharacterized protein n=1 Tax=Portunus trituberculatus TaxID=210409 RepID=A0A5B7CE59_PORTR|nr:hypothetical protein [Portunus trituberculatus]
MQVLEAQSVHKNGISNEQDGRNHRDTNTGKCTGLGAQGHGEETQCFEEGRSFPQYIKDVYCQNCVEMGCDSTVGSFATCNISSCILHPWKRKAVLFSS